MKEYVLSVYQHPSVLSVLVFLFCIGVACLYLMATVMEWKSEDKGLRGTFLAICITFILLSFILSIPPLSYITAGLIAILIIIFIVAVVRTK